MLIIERDLSREIPDIRIPEGLELRSDLLMTDPGLERLLLAHQEVFPRHPYPVDVLDSLQRSPGWLMDGK